MIDTIKECYVPPSIRDADLFQRFIGAVMTRIADRQGWFMATMPKTWDTFDASDIQQVWPEPNMQFVAIKYGPLGVFENTRLADMNLRQLEGVAAFLRNHENSIMRQCGREITTAAPSLLNLSEEP